MISAGRESVATADDDTASLAEIEKRHIRRVLNACRGNKSQAARVLGITRLTPRTKIAEYGWDEFLEHAPLPSER